MKRCHPSGRFPDTYQQVPFWSVFISLQGMHRSCAHLVCWWHQVEGLCRNVVRHHFKAICVAPLLEGEWQSIRTVWLFWRFPPASLLFSSSALLKSCFLSLLLGYSLQHSWCTSCHLDKVCCNSALRMMMTFVCVASFWILSSLPSSPHRYPGG